MLNAIEKTAYELSGVPMALFKPDEGRIRIVTVSDGLCALTRVDRESWKQKDAESLFMTFMSNEPETTFRKFISFVTGQSDKFNTLLGYPVPGTNQVSLFMTNGVRQAFSDGSVYPVIICMPAEEEQVNALEAQRAFTEYRIKSYDPLTGLPTRTMMRMQAQDEIASIWSRGERPVLYYFNVRAMHLYNQQYGLERGDALIKLLSDCIRKVFPDSKLGRGTEDHILVLDVYRNREACCAKVQAVQDAFKPNAYGFTAGIQAGIYIFAHAEIRGSTAVDNARAAVKMLSGDSPEICGFYEENPENQVVHQHRILTDFECAMKERRIRPFYHAIVNTETRKISTLEALARWFAPDGTMLLPGSFISILAHSRQLYRLDLYMVEQVCMEFKDREKTGLPTIPVSVNLSAQDFDHVDMPTELNRILERHGISHDKILLEITEQEFARSTDSFRSQLQTLHGDGYRVWIDDFGSGYSGLNVFSSFHIDRVKFDKDLIDRLDENGGSNRVILRSVCEMCRKLGIHTLAEGVETDEQYDFVRSIGCEMVQGYLFFQPISLEDSVKRFNEDEKRIPHELHEEREQALLKAMRNFNAIYSDNVARDLASDFLVLYLINLSTGRFSQFSILEKYQESGLPEDGDDYISSMMDYAKRMIVPEDLPFVRRKLAPARIRDYMAGHAVYGLTFQMFLSGKPTYVYATFRKLETDRDLMVLFGVRNIDDQMRVKEKISAERRKSLTYAHIARALSLDFANLFYVDLDTERFIEYSSSAGKESLAVERRGSDFFRQSLRDAKKRIHPDDYPMFQDSFNKPNILDTLDRQQSFSLTYRLMQDGVPNYMSMKVSRLPEDAGNHIIVGVSNVDEQMRHREELERVKEEHITYSRISALSGEYVAIYTVDPVTSRFSEYSSTSGYDTLGITKGGEDFFGQSRENAKDNICPDDLDHFFSRFTRENVLTDIRENGLFTLDYRLMIGGVPRFVRLKAALIEEKDGPQLIIGVNDIDSRVRREQEYERIIADALEKVNQDSLTGLQNKHAYVNVEARLNARIENGPAPDFLIAVFDLNGLKKVNDTLGHHAGDRLIIAAANELLDLFPSGLVFRVGGDEFAAVAEGADIPVVENGVQELSRRNAKRKAGGELLIACGCARYAGEHSVASVFERADVKMYENKKKLKTRP